MEEPTFPPSPVLLKPSAHADETVAHSRRNLATASGMVKKAIQHGHIIIETTDDGRQIARKTCPDACTCLPRLPSDRRFGKDGSVRKPAPSARTVSKPQAVAPAKSEKPKAPSPQSYKNDSLRPIMKSAGPAVLPKKP